MDRGRNRNLRPQPRPVRQGLFRSLWFGPRLRSSLPSTPSLPVPPLPGPTTAWHLTSPPMNWPKDSLRAYWAGGQIGQLLGSLFPHLFLLHPAWGNVREILRNSPSPRTHATSLSWPMASLFRGRCHFLSDLISNQATAIIRGTWNAWSHINLSLWISLWPSQPKI